MDSDPSTNISLWPRYQASIFLSPCSKWIPDPHHCRKQHCWVTATLPGYMSANSHTDEELMCYVYQKIKSGRVSMDSEPQHSRGLRCISLPIRYDKPYRQGDSVILEQAITVAAWWVDRIRARKLTVDQRMVFDAPWPCAVSADDLLEVPVSWKKPSYTGWL
ncbi:hypothetical protein MYU51_021777 [Penicillium brevicompactum]|uniref:uncharacterized protein n=1 Tax=Penicillium brevicompactum TaxID=5074 RepID=UPI0025412B1A|nr:uncharacterized protein N7506_003450 [Penicillium brevicompactum]KAJ5343626.1 hypothetical protein N7506_003450 [Penicillium brevicompactum]